MYTKDLLTKLIFLVGWLYLVSSQHPLWAQPISETAFKQAENRLDSARILYSKKHYKYAEAALQLAALYYKNEGVEDRADSMALKGLYLIRQSKGKESALYQRALGYLPKPDGQFIDAQLSLEQTALTKGKKSLEYARYLFQFAQAAIHRRLPDGPIAATKAYEILLNYSAEQAAPIYDYANKNVDSVLCKLAQLKAVAKFQLRTAPNTIPTANALVAYVDTLIQEEAYYQDNFFDVRGNYDYVKRNIYPYLKQALTIYETQLGKESPEYIRAFQLLEERLQQLYPVERAFEINLEQQTITNDSFIFLMRDYALLADASGLGLFNKRYENQIIFGRVLRALKKYHGGTQNRYYQIVKNIQSVWNLTPLQQDLYYQRQIVKQTALEYGSSSQPYAATLIGQANLEYQVGDFPEAMVHYKKAFQILDEIELNSGTPSELPIFEQYIQAVPMGARPFVIKEYNLQVISKIYPSSSPEYITASLEASYQYFKSRVDSSCLQYFNQAIQSVDPAQFEELIAPWLNKFMDYSTIDALELFRVTVPQEFSLAQNQSIFAQKLVQLKETYERLNRDFESSERVRQGSAYEYAQILELMGSVHWFATTKTEGDPIDQERAWEFYQQSLTLFQGINQEAYRGLLKRITNYIKTENRWSVDRASSIFDQLLRAIQASNDYDAKDKYLQELSNYAAWHYQEQRFVDAEPLYRKLIRLYEQADNPIGTYGAAYAKAYYYAARIYRKTGRYVRAKQFYQQLANLSSKAKAYSWEIRALDDWGLLEQQNRQIDKALDLFNSALAKFRKMERLGFIPRREDNFEMALLYSKILRHIGQTYMVDDNTWMAEVYYDSVLQFEQQPNSLLSFDEDISLQRNLADLAALEGDIPTALVYYHRAVENFNDPDELADACLALGDFYKELEIDSLANQFYSKALRVDLQHIKNTYTKLSEAERLLFLKPISKRINRFFQFALANPTDSLNEQLLDAHLIIKGLALETSTNLQSICSNTENLELSEKCVAWEGLKKQLSSRATDLSLAEQDKITDQIVDIERGITVAAKQLRKVYGKTNKNLDFEQLGTLLTSFETAESKAAAIEFFTVEEVDASEALEIVYYAAITTSDLKTPKFIRLATEEELVDVLQVDIAPNTINYIADPLESYYLYQLVWLPMEEFLAAYQQIHLCPTGILGKIAFGPLRASNMRNLRLMDRWSLHYYSSFRDLLIPRKPFSVDDANSLGLVGGVKFTFNKSEIRSLGDHLDIPRKTVDAALQQYRSKKVVTRYEIASRGEDFNPLPGTLKEIERISKLFPSNWTMQQLSDTSATEENVHELANHAPTILHIATHGFFFSVPEEADIFENDLLGGSNLFASDAKTSVEDKIAQLANPLLRSGLALGGINRVWKNGVNIPGMEDGIWTALEVSNLDLFNTELVVLSACETGRGDIDNNEGTIGLQRAFKMAGAKQLIISLWKVPDQQTAELMELFYKAYLNGMSTQKAFEQAQKTMQKRYSNAYYWGAFLLIE